MGGLRRETSTVHSIVRTAKGGIDRDVKQQESDPYVCEGSIGISDNYLCALPAFKQLAEDYWVSGLLDVTFKCPDLPCCPGVARLRIRPSPQEPRCGKASMLESLVSGLSSVLRAGVDITVTYDFREHGPSPQFTQAMSKFYLSHVGDWSKRLKSTAVLVKDNIFSTVARGPVHSFMRACHLGDSLVVCHGEAVAQDFFQAAAPSSEPEQEPSRPRSVSSSSSGSSLASPFVSVVDVVEGASRTCMASLEPFAHANSAGTASEGDTGEASLQAHTFHMLPNGDVRVIQSPAQSVVVATAHTPQTARSEFSCWSREVSPEEAGIDAAGMKALRFHQPKEELSHLVGAHFHVGELVVDAEAEALNRELAAPRLLRHGEAGGTAVSLRSGSRSFGFPGAGACIGCLEGLGMLFLRVGEWFCDEDEEQSEEALWARCRTGERRPRGGH